MGLTGINDNNELKRIRMICICISDGTLLCSIWGSEVVARCGQGYGGNKISVHRPVEGVPFDLGRPCCLTRSSTTERCAVRQAASDGDSRRKDDDWEDYKHSPRVHYVSNRSLKEVETVKRLL